MRSNFHDQDFQVFANLLPVIRCHFPKKNSQVPPRLKVFRRQAPGEKLARGRKTTIRRGSNQNSSAKLVFVSSSGDFVSSPDNFWQLEGFVHPRTVSVLPTGFSELENIKKGSGKLEGEKSIDVFDKNISFWKLSFLLKFFEQR